LGKIDIFKELVEESRRLMYNFNRLGIIAVIILTLKIYLSAGELNENS